MIVGILLLCAALLALLYLYLILPRVKGGADLELLRCPYAHRGLWNDQIPENSLPAFAHAMRRGYGIELDVQRTGDGCVVVFHDDSLKRLCGVDRTVGDLTLAQLRSLRLGQSDQSIPTLKEVLALVRGRVPLMIELKGERPDPILCQALTELLDGYAGPFSVISFSPLILGWFKKYRPSYARGQLVTKITKHVRRGSRPVNFLLSNLLLNCVSRPDFLSINGHNRHRLSFLICTRLFHTLGFVWTIRSKQEALLARKAGLFPIFEKILPPKGVSS